MMNLRKTSALWSDQYYCIGKIKTRKRETRIKAPSTAPFCNCFPSQRTGRKRGPPATRGPPAHFTKQIENWHSGDAINGIFFLSRLSHRVRQGDAMNDCIGAFAVGLLAISMTNPQLIEREPPRDSDSDAIVMANLSTPLKTTRAKAGDRVTATVIRDVESSGKVVIPRKSVLIGHITQVQKRSKSNRESRLGFTFDQIKLKGEKIVPFKGRIERVDQYFTAYEDYQNSLRAPCEQYESDGGCKSFGATLPAPDFYDLKTVRRELYGAEGIVLISAAHEIKLGWNIQIQLRLP